MRNITRSLGLIIGATLLFSSCLPSEATTDNMKLWYDKPADEWMKSLPLGNGRLGAMVYGGVETETIGLNESTMWSGEYDEHQQRPLGRENSTRYGNCSLRAILPKATTSPETRWPEVRIPPEHIFLSVT